MTHKELKMYYDDCYADQNDCIEFDRFEDDLQNWETEQVFRDHEGAEDQQFDPDDDYQEEPDDTRYDSSDEADPEYC
jgi:hypothetical protein